MTSHLLPSAESYFIGGNNKRAAKVCRGERVTETLFKKVDYTLSGLINAIDMGEIGLPDIQRPFVWPNAKVRDLFDSMYKGFPVGYLLFWASGADNGHRIIGAVTKQKVPNLLIVDGQQRLTSLYSVMKGIPVVRSNYKKEKIPIAFRPRDQTFKVTDAATRKDPEFIPNISEIWSQDTDIFELADSFLNRLRASREVCSDEQKIIQQAISGIYSLQNYPFTALELSPAVDEEQVAEIFVRVNSKGTKLDVANFILTLMSVFWDEGRMELETFCRESRIPSTTGPSPFNYFIQPDPDQLLRASVGLGFRRARLKHVYSVLRGKDMETDKFSDELRDQQFSILKEAQGYVLNLQNWHDFFKALTLAGYRKGDMISSKLGLLQVYTLFLIGKRDYGFDNYTLRNLMARWFFMSALTGRYTDSPESQMEQDLNFLRNNKESHEFISIFDRIISDKLSEDYWNIELPNKLATSSAQSPSLFAYYAALNLLEAKVLFSKMKVSELLDPATQANKSAIERHHLFPKGYLKRFGVTETRDTNQIANYALVEWQDNIEISDKSPADYLPHYAARFSSQDLEQMFHWHALPPDWENMDYREFLDARRKLIAQVIREGFWKLQG
jgi:hypothetical protein